MNKTESKSQIEVWKWKDEAYKEVENLNLEEALKQRIRKSIITIKKMGLKTISLVKK